MGKKWYDREAGERSRRFQNLHKEQKLRRSATITVFRPVVPSPALEASLLPVHNCVEEFIDRLGLGGVEKVALNGLRLILMPPRRLEAIAGYDPALRQVSKIKKRISQALPNAGDTIPDMAASHGAVMKDGNEALVALIFDDPRLVNESMAAQEAISGVRGGMRRPNVVLSYIPRLERTPALELNQQLCDVAPQVIASFGPVDFGK